MGNRPRISMRAGQIDRKLQQAYPLIFKANQLAIVFAKQRKVWNLPKSMNFNAFVEGLISEGIVKEVMLDFGADWFDFYILPDISIYHLASYGVSKAYLSHHSALWLWGLIEKEGEVIYINQEQSAAPSKSKKSSFTQAAIDNAFSHERKMSNSRTKFDGFEFVLLKSKATSMLGVREIGNAKKERAKVTDVERTLIDCVVRAAYVGGAGEVVKAFFLARKKDIVDIGLLADYLQELDYAYPYQQSIGFYLQMAGNYSKQEMEHFEQQEMKYDFYLEYAMEDKVYDKHWRIYYPADLLPVS
ncbi:hypothetical protein [Pedobacter sp. UC225_65]|uniref:type IV toxin-antitoxin system AbiEi family antitoxin domain-containing protein n=1 Tax=Pedobacter sp. UC225_65 TaxID=3350173 RepID=UPI00366F56A9